MIKLDDDKRYVVAFSGGADSALLAYHLKQEKFKVRLIHVIHPDSKASKDGEELKIFCEEWAKIYDVPISFQRIDPIFNGFGVEAAERDARYFALFNAMEPDEVLLTAHHLDDSIETVLFRLFRGTSVRGLSGIKEETENSRLIRPLLKMRKKEIQQYVEARSILYRYDNTNDQTDLSRGFIRNKIVPLLMEHFHEAKFYASLKRVMENMQECSELLEDLYNEDLKTCWTDATGVTRCDFEKLSESRQRNFLHHYISSNTGKFLSKNSILEIQKRLSSNKKNQTFEVSNVTFLLNDKSFKIGNSEL